MASTAHAFHQARASVLLLLATTAVLAACTAPPASVTQSASTEPTDAAAGCVADPAAVAGIPLPASADDELDASLAEELRMAAESGLADASADGVVVGVRTPDGAWTEAFGLADRGTGMAMATDEYFRVGSITKTFTGTLVLQLVQRGELSLDDTIDEYVDGVPNGGEVTIRMLLDMTSGIASYTLDQHVADTYLATPTREWAPQELLAAGLSLDPLFAPGAEFNYSNTNFILLGTVIEEVTGRPYAEVLRSEILTPLELNDTSFPSTSDIPAPHPIGSTLQGTADDSREPVDATGWNPSFSWTAGQMISTVDDLLEWGHALATGQGVLDEETSIERLTSFPGEQGYGYAVGCIDGWVGHTGEIPGYNTTVFHDTANDTTVIVLANSDIPTGDCSVSKTLADNTTSIPCMAPATRVFVALSEALGHPFTPVPAS
jgi:D-alanyl-D-alanine carboxypeptidase